MVIYLLRMTILNRQNQKRKQNNFKLSAADGINYKVWVFKFCDRGRMINI